MSECEIDVDSLSQRSRVFRPARTVWLAALRRLTASHSIPESSYLLQRLSVSELERLARLPERFAALVEAKNGKAILSHNLRVIPSRLTDDEQLRFGVKTAGSYEDMPLGAGGRFLMVLSIDPFNRPGTTLYSMWDLGLNLGTDGRMRVLARYLHLTDELQLQLFFTDPAIPTTFWVVSVQRRIISCVQSLFSPLR